MPLHRDTTHAWHALFHDPRRSKCHWPIIFAFPDSLYWTQRLKAPQQAVTIGVLAYHDPQELTLAQIVSMPFGKQRPTWQRLGDGSPERGTLSGAPAYLAGWGVV